MRSIAAWRVLGFALAWAATIACAAAPAAYTGQAPVESQSDQDRADALKAALGSVVVERTGDPGVLARADVAKALAQAERYVLQFQYRPNPGADAAPKFVLVAEFDSSAVDAMLQRLGLGEPSGAAGAVASDAAVDASVWIGGIRDADDYAHVIGYLAKNNFVRGAQPMRARGDGMLVKLTLATDLAHFLDVVGTERTLSVVGAATPADGADATLALAR
ncbi:MAG TPA: DUF2066 domain-containing protein [Dokdonella sp.]